MYTISSSQIDIKSRAVLSLTVLFVLASIGLSRLLLFFAQHGPANYNYNSYEQQSFIPVAVDDKSDTITLTIVGDVMCHSTQFNAVNKNGVYDFTKVFSAVKPYLSTSDLSFANLETVTAGSEEQYTGYPQFNTPAAMLDALKDAGFDVLTTSNNHSLDRRFKGIERTIDSLDARGFKHTGTYKFSEDTSKVLVVESKGYKLAVFAYTFGTNGIPLPTGKEFCVSLMDSARMKRDVERAKQSGADQIAMFIHWGNEYERVPNNRQKEFANYLSQIGVDFIFGSHPHVIQPTAFIENNQKKTFVIYSLGNFVSGQRKPFTDYGTILRVQLIKNRSTGAVRLNKVDFIPTYVSANDGFQIIPIKDAIDAFEQEKTSDLLYLPNEMARMKQIWPEVVTHLSDSKNSVLPAEK